MTETKYNIRTILNNWHIIKSLEIVEAIDVILPIEQGLEKLYINNELDEEDLAILEIFEQGFNINEIAKLIKMSRQTVAARIDAIILRLERYE